MELAMERGDKEVAQLGMPWEKLYGYSQAVRVGNTIRLSGQLSHDDAGDIVGVPASDISSAATMELQMRTTYENAVKVLGRFGAGLQHVVEEVLYVTDMDAAFAVAGTVRKAAYGTDAPKVASTILEITRLALPQQVIEISFTAVLPD